MTTRRTSLHFGAAATALALVLTACGGGSTEGGDTAADSAEIDTSELGPAADELVALYEAALENGEERVVVYAGQFTAMKPVFDAFSERFPGIVIEGQDTFGAAMETTIGQEVASDPDARGDIAHTADTTMLRLADADLLQPYAPPAAEGVEGDQLVYEDNLLTAGNYSFFGNMVNTDVVPDPPQSWEDLLSPDLEGKVTIQDPTKPGSGNGILTTLANDEDYGVEYAQQLRDNGVVSAPSYAEMLAKVADGTYGVAVYAGYTAYLQLKDDGAPVEFLYPVEGGVWIPIEYFGLIEGAPNENAAKLLINYFYTPEGAEALTEIGSVSAAPGSPTPEGIPPVDEIEQLTSTSLEDRLENQASYTEQLNAIFGA